MNQPRVIQRFSSLMLATLLLFTAVWGYGNTTQAKQLMAKNRLPNGRNRAKQRMHLPPLPN